MQESTAAPKTTATPAPAGRFEAYAISQVDNRPSTVQAMAFQQALTTSPRLIAQREAVAAIDGSPRQVAQRQAAQQVQAPANRTGLPNQLKAGVEQLSGHSLDDVRVHYNSAKPAQLQAHAYAQGAEIHIAPGQEEHLPHEAWHVAQQKQGRVQATRQLKGVGVNDDSALEREADVMGARAEQADTGNLLYRPAASFVRTSHTTAAFAPIQGVFSNISAAAHQPAYHNTSFLSRVSLIPLVDETPDGYEASEIWVRQVKTSDDRPPTKFGSEGQRSHTVAWTLMRAGLQRAVNIKLSQFIDFIEALFTSADLPTSDKAKSAATALQAVIATGIIALKTVGRKKNIEEWQQNSSDLLTHFVHFYQLSEAATYADGRAVGHGEPTHMATLRDLDSKANAGNLDSTQQALAVESAVGMFDVKRGLPPKTLAQVLHHWLHTLQLAFPALYRKHSKEIVDGFYKEVPIAKQALQDAFGRDPHILSAHTPTQGLQAGVSTSQDVFRLALDESHQSTFVSNVALKPTADALGTDGQAELTHTSIKAEDNSKVENKAAVNVKYFSFDQLTIDKLKVADDRPKTRFGALQRSHTVAWTLVRRHLMGFTKKSLDSLLKFISYEMNTLKGDIDKPSENANIKFDAPAATTAVNIALGDIINTKIKQPIYQWQSAISELVETYVTLYQLSRSATYAKEETPRGHGEATAYGNLQKANAELHEIKDNAKREEYIEENKQSLAKDAVALVDAVIANGNLPPNSWLHAIDHWRRLLKGNFSDLMGFKEFTEELELVLPVDEPKDELLANYNENLTRKEKILIGLYESAEKELKSFPQQFEKDLVFSIRTSLNASGLVPADYASWDKEIAKIKIPTAFITDWKKPIVEYFRSSRSKGRQPVPTSALNDKEAPSIGQLILDADKYLKTVLSTKDKLTGKILELLRKRVDKTPNKDFLENNLKDTGDIIIDSIESVIEASAISEIDNFKNWFDLLSSIEGEKDAKKESNEKMKDAEEDEEMEDAEEDEEMDSFGYKAVAEAIKKKNEALASK